MSDKIIHGMPACDADMEGMGSLFMRKMKEHGDKIAQINGLTGEKQTYSDLLLRSIRVAQQIQYRGIDLDDIITICTYNSMDSSLPFLAALFLGVRVASLDPTLSSGDSEHLLKLVDPRYVFCGEESVELIQNVLLKTGLKAEIVVFGETEIHIPFSEFLISSGTEDKFRARPVNIYDTAVIFFSSGTTGLPKGICCHHYGLISQQRYLLQGNDVRVCLYFTTFYWISAVMLLIMSILEGGARVICKKFDENLAINAISEYKVTLCFMAPTYTYKLTKYPNLSQHDTSSLKTLMVGGGILGEYQLLALKKLLPHTTIFFTYGMTEACGCVTIFHPINDKGIMDSKLLSVGRPVAGLSYKIIDVETEQICGPNVKGEIMIKGECLMTGYHNSPSESAKVWDHDAFMHTGDVGFYDEDNCFYVVDRIKDMMKFQSWHVVPAELESILLTHLDIKEAAVIGVPHVTDGEHPMGVVVLKPGATASETDILNFFNNQVSDRKQLRGGLRFVDSLPHTPSGKLRRRELRKLLIGA